MSNAALSAAWAARTPSTIKLVLVRLADRADDRGGSIYPAIASLVDDTGLSERAIRNALRALEGVGALLCVGYRSGGRGKATEYRLDLERVISLIVKDFKDEKGARGAGFSDEKGGTTCRGSDEKGAHGAEKGAPRSVKGAPRAPQPSEPTLAVLLGARDGEAGAKEGMREIIASFDEELVAAFGEERRRPYPQAQDGVFAERFLSAGADAAFCRPVFAAGMRRKASARDGPPRGLKYFEAAIADALAERAKPMPRGQAYDQTPHHHNDRASREGGGDDHRRRAAIAAAVARRMETH